MGVKKMKKITIATLLSVAMLTTTVVAENIKMGVILGFTGPIESLTPTMAGSAEMAFKEASDSGKLLDGSTIEVVRADSTCIDAAAATSAAERLITSDRVAGIMGADCSGVTTAIANNVAIPNGVTMISPSATSPALTDIDDNGYFFRTAPSDARGGEILAQVVIERGVSKVAVTYTNNDYGKGLADSFSSAFTALGGTVTMDAAHEDGKGDYSAEVAALSASGANELVVIGYLDQGGRGIIQSSIDSGAFSTFVLSDGMIGQSLIDNVDGDLSGSFGTIAGSDSEGAAIFKTVASSNGIPGDGPYEPESYDAAALMILAMQAGNSSDRASIAANIMNVANAPGEIILPGQLAKGLEILSNGGQVNYQGATNVEFTEVGESTGSFKELEIVMVNLTQSNLDNNKSKFIKLGSPKRLSSFFIFFL
jgi:branched-chain amino acid transport system substrate-binding protein